MSHSNCQHTVFPFGHVRLRCWVCNTLQVIRASDRSRAENVGPQISIHLDTFLMKHKLAAELEILRTVLPQKHSDMLGFLN